VAFGLFLRAGRRLGVVAVTGAGLTEQKFNPFHDPRNGRFTFAPGGAGSADAFIRRGGGGSVTLGGVAGAVRKPGRGGRPRVPIRSLPSEPFPEEATGPGKGHNLPNTGGPPLKDNVPLRALFPALGAAEPGVVIAAAAVLSNPIAPAASLIASMNRNETARLLREIKKIDPRYRLDSLGEPQSAQGWTNHFNQLRWTRATAAYRIKGDHSFLQAETVRFVQGRVDARYDEAVLKYERGELPHRLSREEAIGTYVDRYVRSDLRNRFANSGIPTSRGSTVRVNGREYDTSGTDAAFRIPDARVGRLAIDMTLTRKTLSTPQVRGFFNSDFLPEAVIIIRPSQLGAGSTYVITRPGS
jgi:hypothetical protein